ncbi:MAG: hypothetical protein IPL08_02105 [Saprospiraceae bacterium]|nr:hypothetical protein [Saprospiraceae bacterium]
MLKRIKSFINEDLKQKFNLYNFLGHVILITTSILLAQKVENIKDNWDLNKDKLTFICLLRDDLINSKIDLNRDLNGHKEAMAENRNSLSYIKKIYHNSKYEIKEFNDSINIDKFYTDFQFYPISSTFLSLHNHKQNADLLESFDNIGIKKLYLYDFERIKLLGKEFSQTRNLNAFWEKFNDEYFYISPDEKREYRRKDSKGLGDSDEVFIRHKSSIRELNKDILANIYTKLEKTIEIRAIKIQYYETVLKNTGLVIAEIENQNKKCIKRK